MEVRFVLTSNRRCILKKFSTALLLVGAVLFVSTGVASASSHGAMPAGLSVIEMLNWEFQHFMLHMSLTYQALQLMSASPSLGWAMLSDQTLCAAISPLVSVLFGSAGAAAVTFVTVLFTLAASFLWLVMRARSFMARKSMNFALRSA